VGWRRFDAFAADAIGDARGADRVDRERPHRVDREPSVTHARRTRARRTRARRTLHKRRMHVARVERST
jgi:hypothetical protein